MFQSGHIIGVLPIYCVVYTIHFNTKTNNNELGVILKGGINNALLYIYIFMIRINNSVTNNIIRFFMHYQLQIKHFKIKKIKGIPLLSIQQIYRK